ncbi:ParB/RepB/Spo0J family partition protein [Enterococcus casseliflavus]|uniref:IbrB-like domain-containing protein n=1 Tax=Enterococcus casseliflavus TaxID=37734 RepID=UPI002DB8CAF6|nr:ParB/RepB/Spo0J family partition protein [Enterococcus casseliflavus]MEB8418497.1 ParB/RepB/Spo0J family partition protein [Enterococcus casseliflavus]
METEKRFLSPVYKVYRIPISKIYANDYNPNIVPPIELKLLEQSILADGYTMPIVCYYVKEKDYYEIVDGYHRYLVMKKSSEIAKRESNYLPVVIIDKPRNERIVSTIRHNRARGTHSIDHMVEIIRKLVESGLSDQWIMKNLGMSKDELLRLKQLNGIASLFSDNSFSDAWIEI